MDSPQKKASKSQPRNQNKENKTPAAQTPAQNPRPSPSDLSFSATPVKTPVQNQSVIRGDSQINPQKEGGQSASQKAAAQIRDGLGDLQKKMAEMKEKKERAEKEMLKELEAY